MIINREHTEAAVSSNVEVYAGGIALNAETFDIIISGIYRDKLLAACREPVFNAIDSHIQAGNIDTAIQIHSPTSLEPWFSVKDSGVGMDKDTVTKLFMMLGMSTKRDSNEMVGAKGIGSKAPFAYTDMFTVTSVFDGVQTAYSVYKDRGLPKIAVLSSVASEEPNGVEVKFSVEPKDVEAARAALKKFMAYVRTPYEINDPYIRDLIAHEAPKVWSSHELPNGWRVEFYRDRKDHQNVVVMGQQPYVSETLKAYPPCAVFVPIGTCDVSPGREYTEEGEEDGGFSEELKRAVENVANMFGEKVVADLDKCKDILEVREYFNTGTVDYFTRRFGYEWLRKKMRKITGEHTSIATKTSYHKAWRGWSIDRDKALDVWSLAQSGTYLYADRKSSLKARAVHLAKEAGQERTYVIFPNTPGGMLAEDEFFKPAFVTATSFNAPKLPTVRAARTGSIRVCVIERNGEGYEQWVNKDALSEVEFYEIKSSKSGRDSTWMGEWDAARKYIPNQFDNLGVSGDEIWLVTPAAAKYLPETAHRVDSSHKGIWVKNTKADFEKWFLRKCLGDVVRKKRELRKLFGTRTLPLKHEHRHSSFDQNLGTWNLAAERLHNISELQERSQKILNRYERLLTKEKEKAVTKYPLIKHLGWRFWKTEEVKQYRQLIDSKGEK